MAGTRTVDRWRPTLEQSRAIALALRGLGGPLWRDDLAQAALIRVWQSDAGGPAHAYRHARFGAVDELRRIFGRGERGAPVSVDEAPEPWHCDSPENILIAKQTAMRLSR